MPSPCRGAVVPVPISVPGGDSREEREWEGGWRALARLREIGVKVWDARRRRRTVGVSGAHDDREGGAGADEGEESDGLPHGYPDRLSAPLRMCAAHRDTPTGTDFVTSRTRA